MKTRLVAFIFLFALVALACSQIHEQHATSGNKPLQKSDGSRVETTTAADGTRTEVRTFPSGDVSRVTRTTPPGGKPKVVVELRNGKRTEFEDQSDIDRAMEATGDAIASAARKTWEASKEIGAEIGDKAKEVADKTVDATRDVGRKIGKEAKKAAKKAKDKLD
jgi:hypothetical protein